jgi:uncharacterized protein YprB with RNaseH-like and TPR domain
MESSRVFGGRSHQARRSVIFREASDGAVSRESGRWVMDDKLFAFVDIETTGLDEEKTQ